MEKLLKNYIEKGLEEEVGRMFDIKIEELNRKKSEICAGILLNVMKSVDMQRLGESVVFTIREIKS